MGKWEPEKAPAPLIFDLGSFFIAVPRGCLWPPQTHSGGCSVLLEAEEWVNGALGARGHPQQFIWDRPEPGAGTS